ncbi:hypothetical protein QYE76_046383 [Lolium multiflorum]|uniref:Transposase (putative) gypsy type domain-containing protein n=1 Tax=Lolium multiflorum TaxID=4521 RepID=A0AAD8TLZ8_LOLMU|nr:hypothetical protein QYE76_046383 [Lolium multiflorum]
MAAEDLEWERSKISNQDTNTLKRLGLMTKEDAIRFPSEESYPKPPMEYRVSFVDHLIRGLSTPIHDFLRGLLFVYGIQLHQLTPNSILHISIFITLCECFLGIPPNWALWKRIFCLRRNGSHNVTYNIGGVVICVRTDVDYFDVKFPDSVQGWRKKWLYIHEESANSVEHNIMPFDGSARIQRRRSWDAEASEEEKKATEALMSRIRQLQNTRGKELSGVQITAYFLRIRVQPLQARKNPLWTYSGKNDANRISGDLSTKDLEKLVRRLSRLGKDPVPSSCRVEPYSSANPLPENHPTMTSLPPLPEGGEVEEMAIVAEDTQGSSVPESEVAGSHKSAASHEKEVESEASESTQSLPPAVSPRNKRKRTDAEDSGTSKAEEVVPSHPKAAYDPYVESLVSSDDEEEVPITDVAPRTSTSRTVLASDTLVEGEETSPPQQNVVTTTPPSSPRAPSPKRARVEKIVEPAPQLGSSSTLLLDDPMIKDLLRIGSQFIGYREYANRAEEKLAEANERADALAQKLEQSEAARKKAELAASKAKVEADEAKAKAAGAEELQKKLDDAIAALDEHKTAQALREEGILKRLKSQSRRTLTQTNQDFDLDNPVNDPLLDALSLLEFHGREIREGAANANAGLSALFPYFFPKKEEPATFLNLAKMFNTSEDLGLKMRQENMKVAVENTVALVADSRQTIDWMKVGDTEQIEQSRWKSLIKAAKPNTKKILAYLGIKPASTPSSSRPELIFDNYTPSSAPSNVSPSSSHARRAFADTAPVDDTLSQELDELRQQLQYAKKQTLVMMEQSRKSSEAEKVALQQAHEAVAAKEIAASEAEKATTRENFMLELMNEASADMSGAFTDAAAEEERVNARTTLLVNLSLDHGSLFWATPERTRQIVRFQDRASQTRDFLDFCTKTLSMVYNSMFPRNVQPKTLPDLMERFRDARSIHDFVRAQLVAGARFALIMLQICHSKLDLTQVVEKVHQKVKRRRVGVDRINTKVTPIAEEMIEDLLRMDADFFADGHYADFLGAAPEENRVTLDDILNQD